MIRPSMTVGRAVFSSVQGAARRGYHLVARSPSISDGLARNLARWCPTHGALLADDRHASSINYCRFDRDCLTVSRTVYGAPEYSSRGALQVVTNILAFRPEQLDAFDQNPLALARSAFALGHLRLSSRRIPERIPDIELPGILSAFQHDRQSNPNRFILERCLTFLSRNEPVALIDNECSLATLGALIRAVPESWRCDLSFTTGLKPSPDRPFRIHMLPFIDQKIHALLSALGIRFIADAV